MKKNMSILLFLSSIFASTSQAQNTANIVCKNIDFSIEMEIEGSQVIKAKVLADLKYDSDYPQPIYTSDAGESKYSFIMSDWNDTNTWFDLSIKDGQVVSREVYESGNDADNNVGDLVAEGDAAFICKVK